MNALSDRVVIEEFEDWVDELRYNATQSSGLYQPDIYPDVWPVQWSQLLPIFLRLRSDLSGYEAILTCTVKSKHEFPQLLDLCKWKKATESLFEFKH
jgi:hypothetical protein